jgi:hypothetical protein
MSILSKRINTFLALRPSEEACRELMARGVKKRDCDNAMLIAAALVDKAALKDVSAIKEIDALCQREDALPTDRELKITLKNM